MILCCNGIRFFSIRITSYSKCNFLPRQTLQARPATKLNNIFLILLLPTERRAYNTSSFLYPDTVLTAFGNSRQYTGFSESKDGTHTVAEALIAPVTVHVTIGVHGPGPHAGVQVLRRRPKPVTVVKNILAGCGNFPHPCV